MPPRSAGLAGFREQMTSAYGHEPGSQGRSAPVIPSGSLTLDVALRSGGWLGGRIHEIVGTPDVGKSTLVICSMREAQRLVPDRAACYIDVEGTFDDSWAAANGLDLSESRFYHDYADTSEEASDKVRAAIRSKLFSVVVVDSIGGMESMKATEDKKGGIKDAQDELPGRNAQVITRMVKHSASLARNTCTTVLVVNQFRVVIGGFGGRKPAGPAALQHATTTRVEMSRGAEAPLRLLIDGVSQPVSVQSKALVARSKAVAPGGVAEFWISNRDTEQYGPAGINWVDEYVTRGIDLGVIIQKGGGHYQAPGAPQVRGREALIAQVLADGKLKSRIRDKVIAATAALHPPAASALEG